MGTLDCSHICRHSLLSLSLCSISRAAMKGKAYESNGHKAPSPPPSPPPQRRRFLLRSKSRRHILGVPLRRYLFVLPLLYVSGLLMCVGPFIGFSPLPGAVYRSHQIFDNLWPDIDLDNSSSLQVSSVWTYKKRHKEQKPCPTTSARHRLRTLQGSGPTGYLVVDANGGLNQQRSAICSAVAVAGLLNAVLVIPSFEFHNVWRDPSEFSDIYDVDRFISILGNHVKVVKELPNELMEKYHNGTKIPSLRVQAWSPVSYYLREVYPLLLQKGVVRLSPFANRLSMNVPPHIQFLRCLANYKALRFSSPISALSNKLVKRMIEKSSINGGKYVSVHLRFEEDMVAFSCCVYDGSSDEKYAMNSFRENGWKGKFKRKDRVIMPGLNRMNGKCPLTPLEVGMLLRGMGFDKNTSIYLASGKIYQAQKHLTPLLKMFPLLHTKESLATPDELAPFEGFSSRLAALDYTVSLHSEVFVTTQGGNFPHFLMGHRRFLYDGHAKTIMPDKRKLVLLMQNMTISWKDLKDHMGAMLAESDRKGMMVPRVRKFNRKTSRYTYPLPECRCLQQPYNSTLKFTRLLSR